MYIIVGLGNPGREYADTRHNMGFMALDILAARHNIDIRKENFRSVYGEGRIGTERVILAKPLTFMNNSGWAVRDLVNWFKIEHDQLIVIYDDIDLDPGDLRIREKGSSGSHNGMKSVIYQLGFDDFPRIRVGVGAPEGGRDLIAHVMSMPTGEALDKVKAALNDAADAAELMVSGRIADAQMRFNKKPKRKPNCCWRISCRLKAKFRTLCTKPCVTLPSAAANGCVHSWCLPRPNWAKQTKMPSSRRWRPSKWYTSIRWFTTICRRWTTTVCAAANRPAMCNTMKQPPFWSAMRCKPKPLMY